MALNSLGLGLTLMATNLASPEVRRLGDDFGRLDKSVAASSANLQRGLGGLAAGGAALAAAGGATLAGTFAAADAAGKFEQQIATVGAISRSTAAELQQLHDEAIRVGIATSFSPTQAAEGLGELASQGFNAAESIKLLDSTAALAEGGQLSVAQAARTTASAVRVFSLDLEGAADATDKLLAISNATSLKASDLESALGGVSRGASIAKQSIDEALISIGLVRNTGVDASVAAQSVSSALIFIGQRADKFKEEFGISVTDSAGAFRPLLDIVRETEEVLRTRYPDAAKRVKNASELFSRFGLQAFSAISTQLNTGVRDLNGRLYQGAEAVQFLRRELEKAAEDDAATKFRERLLDTFQGQRTLLRGSVETLQVVVGEAFAGVFRPIVEGIIDFVNRAISFFQKLPPSIKGSIATVAVSLGALASVVGIIVTAAAGLSLALPVLSAAFSVLGSVIVPVLAGVAALGAAAATLKLVFDENIGGVGDSLRRAYEVVSLFVRGLAQAFTDGAFSGAVRDELRRAENSGLRQFIVNLYAVGFRVVQFFRGIGIGFQAALEAAGPSIQLFRDALTRLGEALGLIQARGAAAVAGVPSEEFAARGARIGEAIGRVVEILVNFATVVTNVIGGFVRGWTSATSIFGDLFKDVGFVLDFINEQFSMLLTTLGLNNKAAAESTGFFGGLGQVIGFVAGTIGSLLVGALNLVGLVLGSVIFLVRKLIDAFAFLGRVVKAIGVVVVDTFSIVVDSIANAIDSIIGSIVSVASRLPDSVRPAFVDSLVAGQGERRARVEARRANIAQNAGEIGTAFSQPGVVADQERARRADAQQVALDRVSGLIAQQRQEREGVQRPIVLQVDGETIATAVERGKRSRDAGAFRPVTAAE